MEEVSAVDRAAADHAAVLEEDHAPEDSGADHARTVQAASVLVRAVGALPRHRLRTAFGGEGEDHIMAAAAVWDAHCP